MKINSIEVARAAGVSRSTVSRVINNNPSVNEKTRRKVLKVIEELDYTPNTSAQNLAGKKNDVIGVFIFDDRREEIKESRRYFEYFMNFITTVTEEAFLHKKQILIDIVDGREAEARLKGFFYNGNVSGGIFIGSHINNPFIDEFIGEDYPIALIDYSAEDSVITDNVSLINTDDFKGAYDVTCDLIEEGCRRIVHVSGDKNKLSGIQRRRGYLKALEDNNIEAEFDLILEGNYDEIQTEKVISDFIDGGVGYDGIFAASDTMAIEVLKVLRKNSCREVPVWGYDNLKKSFPLGIKSVDPRLNITAVEAIKSLVGEKKPGGKAEYTQVKLVKSLEDYLELS